MRWAIRLAIALPVVAVLAFLVVFSRGRFDRISVSSTAPVPKSLAAVCLSRAPRSDRRLLARCVRVSGTLLYIRRGYDERSRLDEIHLLVAAHFHFVVVKLTPPFPSHLGIGDDVTAVGPLLETRPSRLGVHEVEAFSFSSSPASAGRGPAPAWAGRGFRPGD